MTDQRVHCLPAFAIVLLGAALSAQDWPSWRGPTWNGATEAADLPTDFGIEERVLWKTPLPGPAASTPIVVGDRVFLSSVDAAKETLVAMCVSRTDGKILWRREAGSGYRAAGAGPLTHDNRSNYASPSPATDGERVLFFFGNGDLVAYDLAGKEEWRRNLQQDYGDFAFLWTFSASPTMWGGKIFLPVLQRDTPVGGRGRRAPAEAPPIESFVLVLDPATGKTLHRQVRPSPARVESLEAYTTMIPWVGAGGRAELLLAGGDVVTGHDASNGKELWRWGTWNPGHRQASWRLVPSIVVGEGLVLVCAPKRAPVYAVKLGGSGELGEDALAWQSEGRPNPVSSDVPTPAFYRGHFYVLSDVESALSRVAAKDGSVAWTTRLARDYLWRASPTAADGKIWCMNHNGQVVVVDAESGKIVHEALMGGADDDQIRSSIAIAHGALFLRTNTTLFCVGKGKRG